MLFQKIKFGLVSGIYYEVNFSFKIICYCFNVGWYFLSIVVRFLYNNVNNFFSLELILLLYYVEEESENQRGQEMV